MRDRLFHWGKKWETLVVIILFSTIITGCIQQEEDTVTLALEDYFRGELIAIGEPALDSVVELVLTLNPPVDSLDTEVNFILPEGIELVEGSSQGGRHLKRPNCRSKNKEFIYISGPLEWSGDLKKEQKETFQLTIKTTEKGLFEIVGVLTYSGEKSESSYCIYVF